MLHIKRHRWLLALLMSLATGFAHCAEPDGRDIAVLVYHRFGPTVADSMTVRTADFASQLEYLKSNGYTVIPLRSLVAYMSGDAPPPPERSVVITADDGHESVFTQMYPLISRYHVPVTLFIYPSAISNANYALTWQQLRQMQDGGLVDIQSHTYWHPNFKNEKKRLDANDYRKFVGMQFSKSKQVLEKKTGKPVDMLAWPFGIFDDELMSMARDAGYRAAFTLERRSAVRSDNPMAIPRYLMVDQVQIGRLLGASRKGKTP